MPRYKHYSQLVFFDLLAVVCIIGAALTGWLPGPGGIPLFLVGLSLLAINHEWAQRHVDLVREYADKISDLIFIPKLRVFFDVMSAVLLVAGATLLFYQNAIWMISLSVFLLGLSVVSFFGNRNRWARFKKTLTKKH